MKQRILHLLTAVLLTAFLAGCYNPVDGTGLKAGVPFKKDRLVSRYERPMEEVFKASKVALEMYGTLSREDRINNTVSAKVDQRTVWVKVIEEDPNLSTVIVQVRTKGGGTDLELANEIDKQIALRLVE